MIRIISLVLTTFLLTPQVANALPEPAKSEYFETVGAGFLVERDQGLYYGMTYKVLEPFETLVFGTVTFQNPSNKKQPYVVQITIEVGQEKILVQSPIFRKIKNKKNYRVRFDLFDTEARENRLNRHTDKVNFSLPARLATQMGIELL